MKRTRIWKWPVRACWTLLVVGFLSLATGCDQLEGMMGVASAAVRDSVANTITGVVGGVLDSAVGGLFGSNTG